MSTSNLADLYSSGDIILQNPIESSAIFLMVVVVCASIEYLFALGNQVESKFFRVMFETISEEVLVIGVLSLLLTFATSVISSLPQSWSVMLDWAHICLLFMALMLVLLLCVLCYSTFVGNKRWAKFEMDRIRGVPENHSAREKSYRLACLKFQVALKAFDYPTDICFANYLMKAEKVNLVTLGNLTWKSWLALSTLVILNALRTRIIPQTPSPTDLNQVLDSTGELYNIASFILVVGYGSLGMFLEVHRRLSRRFEHYLTLNPHQTAAGGGGTDELDQPLTVSRTDLDDPQTFLVWQSASSTLAVLQAIFIFLVWYCAVFFLNALYHTFQQNIGLTLLLICAALAPVVVFVILAPWTLSIVAMLSSLGINLNEEWLQQIQRAQAIVDARNAGGAEGVAALEAEAVVQKMAVERKALRPVMVDETAMVRLAEYNRTKGR